MIKEQTEFFDRTYCKYQGMSGMGAEKEIVSGTSSVSNERWRST
jgi:hypothetical protein